MSVTTLGRRGECPRPKPFSAAPPLRSALESAGVEFIDENGGGVGVRFKKPARTTPTKR
jgi:hypothetical protein